MLYIYFRLARYAARTGVRVILEWHEGQDIGEAEVPGARRYVQSLMPRLLSRVDAHVVHSDVDLRDQGSLPIGRRTSAVMPHGRTCGSPCSGKPARSAGRGTAVHVQRPWVAAVPEPGHDAGLVAAVLGEISVVGFLCAGELGPVGGQNFLHAYTASIALFPQTGR